MENIFKHDNFEEYVEINALNSSRITNIAKSPHHFKFYENKKNKITPSMEKGKLIHEFILEPGKFKSNYAVLPDKLDFENLMVTSSDLKQELKRVGLKLSGTKEELIQRLLDHNPDYNIWECIVEQYSAGKKPLTEDETDLLLAITESINKHKHVKAILKKGDPEISGYWFDEELNLPCKMRADWITESGYIVDLKTTTNGDLFSWQKKLVEFRYDIQAAWYCRGYEKIRGEKPKGFIHFLVETTPPYNVYLYNADATVIECGETGGKDSIGYMQAIDIYKQCLATDNWPMPQEEIQNESMPDWFI